MGKDAPYRRSGHDCCRRTSVVQARTATVMCLGGVALEPPAICRREPWGFPAR
jgi:hypothetical protein